MKIIGYLDRYAEDVKNLLIELQGHIAAVDREQYNRLTDDYREEYFAKTMNKIREGDGQIFLAEDHGGIIGLIIGVVNNEETETYDFIAPKRGRILELIVTEKYRSNGVGEQLLHKMEEYFHHTGCRDVLIDVFAGNEIGRKFYTKNGYFDRCVEVMKKL